MSDNTKNKLLHINRLHLPSEILNLVKSYAFYDYNEEKKKHKVLYSPGIDEINHFIIRVTDRILENSYGYTEDATYWMFMNINRTVILHDVFCKKCGDYVESSCGLHPRITCFCNVAND